MKNLSELEQLRYDNEEYRLENDALAITVRRVSDQCINYRKHLNLSRLFNALLVGMTAFLSIKAFKRS